MFCTPSYLFVDMALWFHQDWYSIIMRGFQNYTPGDPYDCAITSVPCESNITLEVVFSQDHAQLVYWYDIIVTYVGMTILLVSGIIGNILNIVIFSTNKIANESTNLLLLATAVSDLFHCLFHCVMFISSYLCFVDVAAAITGSNIGIPVSYYHNRWLSQLSLDFVTVLAVQRATAVMLPFRASILFSYRNTKIIVAVLGIVCLVTIIPLYYFHFPAWVYHPYFNRSISLGYYYNLDYHTTFSYQLVYSSIRGVASALLIVIAVTLTILKLKEHGKTRSGLKATEAAADNNQKSSSQMSTREMKAMRMSLAVCIVTLLVQTAVTVMLCVNLSYITGMFTTPIAPFSLYGSELCAKFSCSFNFFLYLIMSPQYKTAFTNLFKRNKNKI